MKNANKMNRSELIEEIARGNESARECINFLMDTTEGAASKVVDTITMPNCKDKEIIGDFLGLIWECSDKDLLIFTMVVKTLPHDIPVLVEVNAKRNNGYASFLEEHILAVVVLIKDAIKQGVVSLESLANQSGTISVNMSLN